jgi:type II secretory pathway pseudopilin PulG
LIEMAVVLLLVTLLLGSILIPLSSQVDQRRVTDTEKQLEAIKEALIGFAIANRYLPCPAVSSANGVEDRTGTACTGGKRVGFLPWVTLGVQGYDSWGNRYRYSVTPAFTVSDPNNLFALDQATDATWITIQGRDSGGAVINLTAANSVPVVLLSHGKNSYGAISETGGARALPGTWTNTLDEYNNANNNTTFWSRAGTENTSATGGEFDDVVVWISPSILFSRMVAAGRLP